MDWSVESKKAFSLVMQGESLFITGKAGTGKTTLLYEIRRQLNGKKVIAVLAPTGVAAENAGGFTIHSFLRLPLTPYLPKHKIDPLVRQFHNDITAMESCDTCVLVLPCGRSAHTEAGWFAGKGRTTIAYIPERQEPELIYKLFSGVCCSIEELIGTLK